ncbi:metallophosphoesterase family protein [bacterium]|nr:metallophosphoesterase family protein [bacterium]
MKIAITADCHLTDNERHRERFTALEILLHQLQSDGIDHLVIAGDLFNEHSRNYSDFDRLCGTAPFRRITIHVVPGNHDAQLAQSSFTAPNLHVIEKPLVHSFDLLSRPVLFVPYVSGKTMGEMIAGVAGELAPGEWILISHGDWIEGIREPNPYEPGVYMPLTRADLGTFRPGAVFLGHIHKPLALGDVWYPGSLYPLDINETGRRRFLVLDTETGAVTSRRIFTGRLFFKADLVILPVEDEAAYIDVQINRLREEWNLSEAESRSAAVRVSVSGYTADKARLLDLVRAGFEGIEFHDSDGPDLSAVSVSIDRELEVLARLTSRAVDDLQLPSDPDSPGSQEILHAALLAIYGE